MARVFTIFRAALRPGVTAAEFERFLAEEWVETVLVPGARSYVLKGDRGSEIGCYRLVIEYDRRETGDLYQPRAGEPSVLYTQLEAPGLGTPEAQRAEAHWDALVQPGWAKDFTDWEVIAE